MTRVVRSLILATFFTLSAGSLSAGANDQSTSLWVVFESGTSLHRARVSADAERYVRDFVAGRAPVEIPATFAARWRTETGLSKTASIRVVRAEECSAGECSRLRGLYAGRSIF